MELPELPSKKILAIIVLVIIIIPITFFTISPDLLDTTSVSKPDVVDELETVVEDEPVVLELDTISENATGLEIAIETAADTVVETITEPIIEIVPDTLIVPEILDIEIIEDPEPTIEIPEIPITIPTPPDDIPEIPEKTIQDKVDRFNADPGTPVPAKGAISGSVERVIAGNMIKINGIEIRLSGVSNTNDGNADLWRQALMRLCPVDSLALYKGSTVWCYGYPVTAPLASVNEVMNEADYDIIGRGCSASSDTRLLGCTS